MTASELENEAKTAFKSGNYVEAEKLFSQASTEAERSGEKETMVSSLIGVGRTFNEQAQYEKARIVLERACQLTKETFGEDSTLYMRALTAYGWNFALREEFAQAEETLKQAISTRSANVDPNDLVQALNALGLCYCADEKCEQGKPLFSQALGMSERTFGSDSEQYGRTLGNLAYCYLLMRNETTCEVLSKRALSVQEKQLGVNHPSYARTLHNEATRELQCGKFREAVDDWKRALPILEKSLPEGHPTVIAALNGYASALFHKGSLSDARDNFDKGIKLAQRDEKANRSNLLAGLLGLGMCFVQLHRYPEAETYFERAKTLVTEAEKAHTERHLVNTLFNCYLFQGKLAKALNLVPDQLRADNESRLTGIVNLINAIANLAKNVPWPNEPDK